AITRPKVSVAVLAEAMRLDKHSVAEGFQDVAVRIEMDDGRLGSVMQPGSAATIGNDANRRARLDVAEMRPVFEHLIGVRHCTGWGSRARALRMSRLYR